MIIIMMTDDDDNNNNKYIKIMIIIKTKLRRRRRETRRKLSIKWKKPNSNFKTLFLQITDILIGRKRYFIYSPNTI